MHLQTLVPSLKLACSTALARHAANDINSDAYLAIGLDANSTPTVFFVNDPPKPTVPRHITSANVLFAGGLIPLTNAVAGLGLDHEIAVERMAHVILPKIPTLIFGSEPKDTRFLELGTELSNFAAQGIIAAIQAQAEPPAKPARLENCPHPERN